MTIAAFTLGEHVFVLSEQHGRRLYYGTISQIAPGGVPNVYGVQRSDLGTTATVSGDLLEAANSPTAQAKSMPETVKTVLQLVPNPAGSHSDDTGYFVKIGKGSPSRFVSLADFRAQSAAL